MIQQFLPIFESLFQQSVLLGVISCSLIVSVTTPYNVGSVLQRLFSTAEYWTASAVLMLSLRSTDAIPPQYWCYPPTVLMLSPRSTDAIPPQYWCYPPAVLTLSLHSTDAIPPAVLTLSLHSTDAIPTVLMLSPAVLNSLRSTDAIPPQYWIASAVLNSLRSTEQPPQYWTTLYGVVTISFVTTDNKNIINVKCWYQQNVIKQGMTWYLSKISSLKLPTKMLFLWTGQRNPDPLELSSIITITLSCIIGRLIDH